MHIYTYIVFIERQKHAQNIWSLKLVHKKPFGCRVAHHGYLLTSCPRPKRFENKSIENNLM